MALHYAYRDLPWKHEKHGDASATQSQSDWSATRSRSTTSYADSADQKCNDQDEQAYRHMDNERLERGSAHHNVKSEAPPVSMVKLAREMGLCSDYLAVHPYDSECIPITPQSLELDLTDPPGVTNAPLPALTSFNDDDKWEVDREAASVLASCYSLVDRDQMISSVSDFTINYGSLKVDEAVLRGDHELELQQLVRRNRIRYDRRGMVEVPLDVDADESVSWPSKWLDLPAQMNETISLEKLDIDQAAADFMREILVPPVVSEQQMIEEMLLSEKIPSLERLSPPLLPMSPPYSPKAPAPTLLDLTLTSTPEDLTAREADNISQWITEDYDVGMVSESAAVPNHSAVQGSSDTYSDLNTPSLGSMFPASRNRLEDLRVESPLIPQGTSEDMDNQPDSIDPRLLSLMPAPEVGPSIVDPAFDTKDLDDFVKDFAMPLSRDVIEQTEGESLSELDTVMRVPVPQIDDKRVTPPWETDGRDLDGLERLQAWRAHLASTAQKLPKNDSKWHGASKLDQQLPWSPFPARLGKIASEEGFDEDRTAERYLSSMDFAGDPDVGSLICATEALRVLDDHESVLDELDTIPFEDECISDANLALPIASSTLSIPLVKPYHATAAPIVAANKSSTRMNMQTLLRKRKLELEEATHNRLATTIAQPDGRRESTDGRSHKLAKSIDKSNIRGSVLGGDVISAFMHRQGLSAQTAGAAPKALAITQHQNVPAAAMVTTEPMGAVLEVNTAPVIPTPSIGEVSDDTQIVLCTAMLADRSIMRQLQMLLPGLDFVERDQLHYAPAASSKKTTTTLPSPTDADITISPSVGLVLTTLQRLKQKPLPGQSDFHGVQERISTISHRYERLIVLVSDGRCQQKSLAYGAAQQPAVTPSPDERDCAAITDLMAYTSNLDHEVEVYFISGGEVELGRWIASVISRHAVQDGTVRLLQEETLWERFLRSAGLNAFAAQAILGHLKGLASIADGDELCYGLGAFVRMSAQQRLQEFGVILGGDRLLRTVNEVVDRAWTSMPAAAY